MRRLRTGQTSTMAVKAMLETLVRSRRVRPAPRRRGDRSDLRSASRMPSASMPGCYFRLPLGGVERGSMSECQGLPRSTSIART